MADLGFKAKARVLSQEGWKQGPKALGLEVPYWQGSVFLTRSQTQGSNPSHKQASQGSGSRSQASLLINQLCPRVSPQGHQATCSPGSSFPEFPRGIIAPDNHPMADGGWGGGKKGRLISPIPSLFCPQDMAHELRWSWSRPGRQGQESWVPKDWVEGPKRWIGGSWAGRHPRERGGKTHPEQTGRPTPMPFLTD